jgi:hypothetical protein
MVDRDDRRRLWKQPVPITELARDDPSDHRVDLA